MSDTMQSGTQPAPRPGRSGLGRTKTKPSAALQRLAEDHFRCHVVVTSSDGLHLRAITEFIDRAQRFRCDISVRNGDSQADGRSIFEMLALVATAGTQLTLEADGEDAETALAALADVAAFHADYLGEWSA
jgi:phosphotransferase system HPr (HPr) family protein